MDLKTIFFLLAIFCGAALSMPPGKPETSNNVRGLENYREGDNNNPSIGNYLILWERNDGKTWTLNVKGQRLAVLADVPKHLQTKFNVNKYKKIGGQKCNTTVFYTFEVSQSVDKSEVGKLVAVSDNKIVLMKKPSNWNGEATKIRSEFVFRLGFYLDHPLKDDMTEAERNENKIFSLEAFEEIDDVDTKQWNVEPQDSYALTLSNLTTKFNLDAFFKLVQVEKV